MAGTEETGAGILNTNRSSWTSGRRTVELTITTDDVMNLADVTLVREVRAVVERALEDDPGLPEPIPDPVGLADEDEVEG